MAYEKGLYKRQGLEVTILRGGPEHPAGDLATVCNQDFREHVGPPILKTPKRVSSTGAFSAARSDSATTSRVVRGSLMTSSHRRAQA